MPESKVKQFPVEVLKSVAVEDYELRVVIWGTKKVPLAKDYATANIQVEGELFDGEVEIAQVDS